MKITTNERKAMKMTKEEIKRFNLEQYGRAWDDLSRRDIVAAQTIDRAVLFTSLPIIGLSIAFFRPYSTTDKIFYEWLFYFSSITLLLGIFSVIFSCWTTMFAKEKCVRLLKGFYVDDGEKLPHSKWITATRYLNYFSTLCYFLGILSMALFFHFNFPHNKEIIMGETEYSDDFPEEHTEREPEIDFDHLDLTHIANGMTLDFPEKIDDPDDSDDSPSEDEE